MCEDEAHGMTLTEEQAEEIAALLNDRNQLTVPYTGARVNPAKLLPALRSSLSNGISAKCCI